MVGLRNAIVGIGVDIGGSGIKAAPVDLASGQLARERIRIATPRPATPAALAEVVAQLVVGCDHAGPVGCTFPGVVRGGRTVESAANIHPDWIGLDAVELLAAATGRQVVMVNDADAAALAEVAFGAAKNHAGLVMMVTLGTGIGTGLVHNGVLIPNNELGHVEIDGADAEEIATARIKKEQGLTYEQWIPSVNRYLRTLERLIWPDLFVLGGGVSKEFDLYAHLLDTRTPVVPAELRNHAGIIGAALKTGPAR